MTCRRDVTRLGFDEASKLADRVGSSLWVQALAQLGRPVPQADCERVLGFGALLTAYLLPPVPIDEERRREVCTLGAHANLLVGLFDLIADERSDAELPLSRALIESACKGRGRARLAWHAHRGSPPTRLLTRLLSEYVDRLDRLPYSDRHQSVRALQTRVILEMYTAELQTLRAASRVTDRIVRRKSALPFVAMGIPGWLAVDQVSPATFRAHLRWMYRIGTFFGWIDDAVDLDLDRAAGRPNRVADSLAVDGTGNACDRVEHLARAIAREGTRIQAERRVSASQPDAADVLTTTVLSWLDAIPR